MSDREKKIAEILEALEKATPGRWIYDETVGDVYSEKTDEIICCADVNDARLIANAPEWLRFLLDELDKRDECTKENPCRECLKMSVDGYKEIVRELEDENRKLREERDKLIEGLRWYADTKNYEYRTSYLDQDAPIIDDSGQRAREILKEIGVTDV